MKPSGPTGKGFSAAPTRLRIHHNSPTTALPRKRQRASHAGKRSTWLASYRAEVRPASIRSLDAIHVATALVAGINRFASFDARQRIAAEEMEMKLVGASI